MRIYNNNNSNIINKEKVESFGKTRSKLIPKKDDGSKIHIKKKNEGKFTDSANRAGMNVQDYARKVLNDPNAAALQKKRANFARNAKTWKHQQGGFFRSLNSNNK